MDKVKPNSEPETQNAPSTFGGRRRSSGSPQDGFVGLLFMPLFWAGSAMVMISVIVEVWSPVCFVAGALISTAIRDAVEQASEDDEANVETLATASNKR